MRKCFGGLPFSWLPDSIEVHAINRTPRWQARSRAGTGHVGHGRKQERSCQGSRGAPFGDRTRHDVDRHRGNVRRRRCGKSCGRCDRRSARPRVYRHKSLSAQCITDTAAQGVRAQSEAPSSRNNRSVSFALARKDTAARRNGKNIREASFRRKNQTLGRLKLRCR